MAESKKNNKSGRPGIDANVWSRFDDDGYGIKVIKRPGQKSKGTSKKKK